MKASDKNIAKEKIFEFRGLALKTLVAGATVGSLLGVAAFFALHSVFSLNHPGFMLIITVPVCLIFLAVWNKYSCSFWRVRTVENLVEIYKDGKPYFSFELSSLKRLQIHGFGWDYKIPDDNTPKKVSSVVPFYVGICFYLKNFWKSDETGQTFYRALTIDADGKKFRFVADSGQFVFAATIQEIKAFDHFFAVLENYAIRRKYEKINLTSETWTPKRIRKYRYVRKTE